MSGSISVLLWAMISAKRFILRNLIYVGGYSTPVCRATRSGVLCERVKRERLVGRQLALRAERRTELVQ